MYENGYNGINRLTIEDIEYTIWTYANVVRKHVRTDLKKRFPGKIIARELNSIDYTLPELNFPVEIAATIATKSPPSIKYKLWENSIRNQIEQNIVATGNCLLYFDSELLRALQNSNSTQTYNTNISINLDWFRKYIKEEKLIAATISYDGIIKQIEYKDLDFLAKISQTCPIAAEEDNLVLNRNKMNIYTNVVKGYGFTPDEVEKIEDNFEKYCYGNYCQNKGELTYNYRTFLLKSENGRLKLYGQILYALDDLSKINKILCREIDSNAYREFRKYSAKILGIFNISGMGGHSITTFVDKFDICKYFPGYLRNEKIWEKLRRFRLTARQFENIITGEMDVINGYLSQKSVEDW